MLSPLGSLEPDLLKRSVTSSIQLFFSELYENSNSIPEFGPGVVPSSYLVSMTEGGGLLVGDGWRLRRRFGRGAWLPARWRGHPPQPLLPTGRVPRPSRREALPCGRRRRFGASEVSQKEAIPSIRKACGRSHVQRSGHQEKASVKARETCEAYHGFELSTAKCGGVFVAIRNPTSFPLLSGNCLALVVGNMEPVNAPPRITRSFPVGGPKGFACSSPW